MKRVIFLAFIMLSIQFCTIEMSEIDALDDEIVDLQPDRSKSEKVPKEAYLVQYFTSKDNTTPISSRIEEQIQHDFNNVINSDYASADIAARWIGDFNFKNEEYTFDVLSDKAIKVFVDGVQIYDDDISSGRKGNGKMLMKGKHRIVVEYNLTDSTATSPLESTSPDPSDSTIVIVPTVDSVVVDAPIVEEVTETPTVEVDWLPSDSVMVEKPDTTKLTDILTFSFPEQTSAAIINSNDHTVTIEVAEGADLTSLKSTFTLSDGATSDPESGTTGDYSNAVIITVTASDGTTTQEWTVTVLKAKSKETDILSFSLPEQTGDATINSNDHTVAIEVAEGADLTSLKPTFTLSDGATSDPESGIAGDYSKAVTITVVAEDDTTAQDWTVNVSKAKSKETDILTFALPEQTGAATINSNDHTVSIEVAEGTDLTNLRPTFTLSAGATSVPSSETVSDYSSAVTITVTAEDATTAQNWIINVSAAKITVGSECVTNGGRAGDSGLKTWCWSEIPVPVTDGSNDYLYLKELVIDNTDRWYLDQITNVGNQLKFHLDPTTPAIGKSSGYNFRAEIRTAPWNIQNPPGTEEWFGWSYTLGDDYIIDQENEWLFWQVQPGVTGVSPHAEIMIINQHQYNGHEAGEIYVINKGNYPDNHPTGIVPKAGDKLDIVVHAIWDHASKGHLQVWINGVSVYDKQAATIYADYPWAGNAKWGIYKWPYRNDSRVQLSLDQGITHLDTYMGPLRMITRYPGDPDYGKDSYSQVAPR